MAFGWGVVWRFYSALCLRKQKATLGVAFFCLRCGGATWVCFATFVEAYAYATYLLFYCSSIDKSSSNSANSLSVILDLLDLS
jgi:hypothetical protein